MVTTTTMVRQSYIDLRGINLGTGFIKEAEMTPGHKYPMVIEGVDDIELEGTLDKSGFIGGLARLYREFDLAVNDKIVVDYDGKTLTLKPPAGKRCGAEVKEGEQHPGGVTLPIFERQRLKHIHMEPYAPGNLGRWLPRTEPDVYMVFGALSEYTDYRYCCGTSQILLSQLGYKAETKPDAILIDRPTGQYLIAEFKMKSSEFAYNHKPEDVDVLVCWEHDEQDKTRLPRVVVCLHDLLERAVRDGDIDL